MRSMQKGGVGGILAVDKSYRKEVNDAEHAERRQRRDNGCRQKLQKGGELMWSMQKGGRGGIMAASKSCGKDANDAEHARRRWRRDNGCE